MGEIKKKILLIEPPFYRLFKDTYSLVKYPLSLGYLAGMIKRETRWDVMAYNADFSAKTESIKVSHMAGRGFDNYLHNLKDPSKAIWKEVKTTIKDYGPSVIGISAKSQNFSSACMIAKLAKEIDDNIIIIVGGPHPSMVHPDILKCRHIDLAVAGEGENTIVELLGVIGSGKGFEGIKGIIYRKDGKVLENPPREPISDLDTLCFPHETAKYVLRDYDKYPLSAFKSIFSARGCPYNCMFCGSRNVWGRKVRFRSVGNVVKEIKSLQDMGLKFVHFDDDTFGVSKAHITELCNSLIRDCLGLKWSCEIHVKLVDDKTISLMKKAGCYSIQLGVESGNNKILRDIRKGITIEEAIKASRIIKKRGIELAVFFIIGFPQETEETLNDTINAIKKIRCDTAIYSIFTPYPGTEMFEFCREKGIIKKDFDPSMYNHQSPANNFCMNISHKRFRALASKIEQVVDRKNSAARLRNILSLNTFAKVREKGIKESCRAGLRIIIGK